MKFDPKKINDMQPDGKNYQDPTESTLYLRNRKTKTWNCVKWSKGKAVWKALGTFPEMGVAEARRQAAIQKSTIISEKQIRHHSLMPTLSEVFERFCIDKDGIKKSLNRDREYITTGALAHMASRRMNEISSDDIRRIKDAHNNRKAQFNKARALLSVLFNYCRKTLEIPVANPTESVAKYEETARKEKIPIEHSKIFFDELEKFDEDFKDIIKILIYTGSRSINVKAMEWSEIDLNNSVWIIPKEKSKNKKDMATPFDSDVHEILSRRKKNKKSDRWVFPATKTSWYGYDHKSGFERKPGPGHVIDIRKKFKTLCKLSGLPENLRPHDLRRTHGTWMLNAGASIEQVSASLHHSSIAITQKVYAELLTDQIRSGQNLMRQAIEKAKKS